MNRQKLEPYERQLLDSEDDDDDYEDTNDLIDEEEEELECLDLSDKAIINPEDD